MSGQYVPLRGPYYGLGHQIQAMSLSVWVYTTYYTPLGADDFTNWAIFDFDRSEFYNLFVTGDGLIKFSTAHLEDGAGTRSDLLETGMSLSQNNPYWHLITVTFGSCETDGCSDDDLTMCKCWKRIYRDGALSNSSNSDPTRGRSARASRRAPRTPRGQGTSRAATASWARARRRPCTTASATARATMGSGYGYYFDGKIGFTGLHNFEFSAADVEALYDATKKYYQECLPGYYCDYGDDSAGLACPPGYYCPGDWLPHACGDAKACTARAARRRSGRPT